MSAPVTLTLTQAEVSLLLDALYDADDKLRHSIALFTDDKGNVLPYLNDGTHQYVAQKRQALEANALLRRSLIVVWRPNQENAA